MKTKKTGVIIQHTIFCRVSQIVQLKISTIAVVLLVRLCLKYKNVPGYAPYFSIDFPLYTFPYKFKP